MDQNTDAQGPGQASRLALQRAEIQRLKTVNHSLQSQIRQYQRILATHGIRVLSGIGHSQLSANDPPGLGFSGIGTVAGGFPAHDPNSVQTSPPVMADSGQAALSNTTFSKDSSSSTQQCLPSKRKKALDSPSVSPRIRPAQVVTPSQLHDLQATNNKAITSEEDKQPHVTSTASLEQPSLGFNKHQMTGVFSKSSGTLSTAPITTTEAKDCQMEGSVSKRHPSVNNGPNTGTLDAARASSTSAAGNTTQATTAAMGPYLKRTNPVKQECVGGGTITAPGPSASTNTLSQPQTAPGQSTLVNNSPVMPSPSSQGAHSGPSMIAPALITKILSQQGTPEPSTALQSTAKVKASATGQTRPSGPADHHQAGPAVHGPAFHGPAKRREPFSSAVQQVPVYKQARSPGSWCQTSGLPAPAVDGQTIARDWAGHPALATGGITAPMSGPVPRDHTAMQAPSFTGQRMMPSTYTTASAAAAQPQASSATRGPTARMPAPHFLHNTTAYITTTQMAKKTKRKRNGRPNRAWVFAYTFPSSECALYILVCPSHGCDIMHRHPLLHNRGLEHIRGHGVHVADEEDMVRRYGCQVINEKHPLTVEWAHQWNEDILQDSSEMHLVQENFHIMYPTQKAQ